MLIISPIAKTLLQRLPSRFYWPIPFGVMQGVRWSPSAANPGQALGRYEGNIEAQFVQLLKECTTFWDVGANVGWFSLLAAKLSVELSVELSIKSSVESPTDANLEAAATTKIVAFEPDPRNLEYLRLHKQLNQYTAIDIVPKALGASLGQARFQTRQQQGRLSDEGDSVVDVITADHYIAETGLVPDLIKLDIEGGELDFLLGAEQLLSQTKPILLLSAHGREKRDQCVQKLSRYDYQLDELVADASRGDYVFIARPQ